MKIPRVVVKGKSGRSSKVEKVMSELLSYYMQEPSYKPAVKELIRKLYL